MGFEKEVHKAGRPQFHRLLLTSCGMWWGLFSLPEAQCNIWLPQMLDRTGRWVERWQTQEKVLNHTVPGAVLHSEERFWFGSEVQQESGGSSVGTV